MEYTGSRSHSRDENSVRNSRHHLRGPWLERCVPSLFLPAAPDAIHVARFLQPCMVFAFTIPTFCSMSLRGQLSLIEEQDLSEVLSALLRSGPLLFAIRTSTCLRLFARDELQSAALVGLWSRGAIRQEDSTVPNIWLDNSLLHDNLHQAVDTDVQDMWGTLNEAIYRPLYPLVEHLLLHEWPLCIPTFVIPAACRSTLAGMGFFLHSAWSNTMARERQYSAWAIMCGPFCHIACHDEADDDHYRHARSAGLLWFVATEVYERARVERRLR